MGFARRVISCRVHATIRKMTPWADEMYNRLTEVMPEAKTELLVTNKGQRIPSNLIVPIRQVFRNSGYRCNVRGRDTIIFHDESCGLFISEGRAYFFHDA